MFGWETDWYNAFSLSITFSFLAMPNQNHNLLKSKYNKPDDLICYWNIDCDMTLFGIYFIDFGRDDTFSSRRISIMLPSCPHSKYCLSLSEKPPLCNVDLYHSFPVFCILFVLFYHAHNKNQLLTDQDQGKNGLKWKTTNVRYLSGSFIIEEMWP